MTKYAWEVESCICNVFTTISLASRCPQALRNYRASMPGSLYVKETWRTPYADFVRREEKATRCTIVAYAKGRNVGLEKGK